MILRSLIAAGMACVLGVTACAHVEQDRDVQTLTERVIRDVCIPFVVDGIGPAEVGRRLGWGWTRNLPDPFTPPAGPIFRSRDATLEVVDGRAQRNPDGSLTSRPLRVCNLSLGRNEIAVHAAVARAVASRQAAPLPPPLPSDSDPALRIVACLPMSVGIAVARASVYADGSTGAGVYQTETDRTPRVCTE